jgi:hypothetical protein
MEPTELKKKKKKKKCNLSIVHFATKKTSIRQRSLHTYLKKPKWSLAH